MDVFKTLLLQPPPSVTGGGGSGTVTSVNLTQPAAGITVSGGPITTSGSITLALANDLAAVEGLAGTGIIRRTGADTWSAGTAVALASEVSGTLPVANGGSGATTLTGVVKGNGTAAMTAGTVALATEVSGTLAATNGGTGQSSYAVGDVLFASTTTAISKLADVATGNALISGGVNTAPSYGKIGLTTHVSGTLPIANGGTNATTAAAALTSLGGAASADVQIFTSSGTWTKPANAKAIKAICIGGGGGGGSGRRDVLGSAIGGAGGGGGALAQNIFNAALLGATETVTVGAAGTGGAAQATAATDGNAGTAGGNTTFGNWLFAGGGGGGAGGTTGTAQASGAGGSTARTGTYQSATLVNAVAGQGARSVAVLNNGLTAEFGGGSGSTSRLAGNALSGGSSIFGGPGGGAGGEPGLGGGTGGNCASYDVGGGGAGGAAGSNNGTAGAAPSLGLCGTAGGGGGGNNAGGVGGNGGAGGRGAGGGGGGAASGNTSGAGGNGGAGAVIVVTYF